MAIAEKKCKHCGSLHTVVLHKGKFWFDGEWRNVIYRCDNCEECEPMMMFSGDYGNS